MQGSGQKTVLVTGCSSGIGLKIAVRLAKDPRRRYYVIATMRDLTKKGNLEEDAGDCVGSTLTMAQLDVCSDESVERCLSAIPHSRVDIVVNNAGIGHVGPIESLSIEDMRKVFETNFFGVVRVIKAVLPDMKRRRSGHIVVISSVMGLQGVIFNDVYAASKFAIEGFCESLAVQLLKFNIFVSMVEPGPVNTEFEVKLMEEVAKSNFLGTDTDTLRCFKETYLPASREIFATMGQSPETVAQVTIDMISMERPDFRRQTNALYTPLTALKYADETFNLSVRTFYSLLFRHKMMFSVLLGLLKCITCRCFRRRVMPT